jgi:glycosyltransferase involved in cell wall biosynthesis
VVIPVYNHAGAVAGVARAARELGFPVIVVDDGSTDDSADRVAGLRRVRLLQHGANQGKGAALLTGFRAAARLADWAVTLDADGQHDPQDAWRLIAAVPAGERPIVVGRRDGMAATPAPWTSRFGRGFSNFWVRAAGGPALADTQSGFRLYPLPETLDLRVRARRYQFEVEVLVKAAWHGLPVREAPVGVVYPPAGERISHFRPWVDFGRNSAVFSRLIFQRIVIPRRWRRRI